MPLSPKATILLAASTRVTAIDNLLGPVARAASALTPGTQVLVVSDTAKLMFREVTAASPASPPAEIITLTVASPDSDHPNRHILLGATQTIKRPFSAESHATAGTYDAAPAAATGASEWLALAIPGARWLVAEGLAIAIGLDRPPGPRPSRPAETQPVAAIVPALRALSGANELEPESSHQEGDLTMLTFTLPPRTTTLRLSSRSARPEGDSRLLGVAIVGITLDGTAIPLESPALVRGFHRAEANDTHAWRWTDGDALLILPPKPRSQTLSVTHTDWHRLLPE